MDQILVVEPWDFEPVLVVEGKDLMTLLTCTPYMINSHRLLVRGHRVPYVPEVKEEIERAKFNYKSLIVPGIVLAVVMLIIFLYIRHRRRRRYEG